MTTPRRDHEALLSAYLAVGMEVLPDGVVDAVLDEVHRTRQRTVIGPWRTRWSRRPRAPCRRPATSPCGRDAE